jgi:maltose alpha-D-glucosyltransferase/alpha-amylase
LLGTAELIEGDKRSAIAVLHAMVVNQGDLWGMAAAHLDRLVEKQRLLAASDHPAENGDQATYLRHMSQSGKRLAELHLALASNRELPDFAPEPTRPEDLQRWSDEIMARAERVFDTLKQRRDSLRDAERLLADQLLALHDKLPDRLKTLLPRGTEGLSIRHHGDLHLGQLLVARDDVFIIDFDGGPGRTIAERRRKAPPARDVAGLIRSIDYAATAALERALRVAPDENGRLSLALADWRDRTAATFLAGYHETMAGQRLWPADARAAERLLSFFLLEKAFYEIEYELANRPDWLRVPLTGLLRILAQQPHEVA